MLELLGICESLEPKAAALAATRVSEHDLRESPALKSALDNDPIERQNVGHLDFALHAAVFEASANAILNGVHRYVIPFLFLMKSRDTTAPASSTGRGCPPIIRPLWKPSVAASRPRRNKPCLSICTMPGSI